MFFRYSSISSPRATKDDSAEASFLESSAKIFGLAQTSSANSLFG